MSIFQSAIVDSKLSHRAVAPSARFGRGDSSAAGEGAPYSDSKWLDVDCHRSKNSGLRLGVKRFAVQNPDIAVNYSHRACSGAEVCDLHTRHQSKNGLFDTFGDLGRFKSRQDPQLSQLQTKLIKERGHARIHLVLMSIGINNIDFATVVFGSLVLPYDASSDNPLTPEAEPSELLAAIQSLLDALEEEYIDLNERILNLNLRENISEGNPQPPSPDVLICSYPDPTKGPKGFCGASDNLADFFFTYDCFEAICIAYVVLEPFCAVLSPVDPIVNPEKEYKFLFDTFVSPLNLAIKRMTNDGDGNGTSLGWGFLDVSEQVGSHGICNCDERWFNTIGDSLKIQGDLYGTAHPNEEGYEEIYEDRVAIALLTAYEEERQWNELGYDFEAIFGEDDDAAPHWPLVPRPCSEPESTIPIRRKALDRFFPANVPTKEILKPLSTERDKIRKALEGDTEIRQLRELLRLRVPGASPTSLSTSERASIKEGRARITKRLRTGDLHHTKRDATRSAEIRKKAEKTREQLKDSTKKNARLEIQRARVNWDPSKSSRPPTRPGPDKEALIELYNEVE